MNICAAKKKSNGCSMDVEETERILGWLHRENWYHLSSYSARARTGRPGRSSYSARAPLLPCSASASDFVPPRPPRLPAARPPLHSGRSSRRTRGSPLLPHLSGRRPRAQRLLVRGAALDRWMGLVTCAGHWPPRHLLHPALTTTARISLVAVGRLV
jgi:hypothetical protein